MKKEIALENGYNDSGYYTTKINEAKHQAKIEREDYGVKSVIVPISKTKIIGTRAEKGYALYTKPMEKRK